MEIQELKRTSEVALRVLDIARGLHPDMTVTQLATLWFIVGNEGCTIKDIGTRLGLPSSTLSRSVSLLMKHHRRGHDGLDLIKTVEDIEDRRLKRVYLTPKGKIVAKQLEGAA